MRILQIGVSFLPGGIESFVMNYYRILKPFGIQYDFVCMYEHLAYEDEIKKMGGNIFYLPDIKKNAVGFIIKLYKLLCKNHYQTVHINMLSAANILPLVVCKICGEKTIIAHSHNSKTEGLTREILHKMNRRLILYLATDFLACSTLAAKWMYPEEVINQNRFKLIHNAVDTEKYKYNQDIRDNIRKELRLENKFVIGNVGRLTEQKNLFFLIDVFFIIASRCENAFLIIAGTGELKEKLRKYVYQLGLKSKILFLGQREDVEKWYSVFDVFCMTSFYEGLSFTAIEAQASGVKCVFSDKMSPETKVIEDVKFLPVDHPKQWADEIMKCNMTDRREEGFIRHAFAARGYELNRQADILLDVYRG